MNKKFLVVACVVLLTITALLLGCDSDAFTSTRQLIVADPGNNRVLIYDAPFTTGQSADVALTEFLSIPMVVPASAAVRIIVGPVVTAVDHAGNLYVAEDAYCRVVQFKPPLSDSATANMAFGQPDLTTANCAAPTSATSLGNSLGLDQVFGVAIDHNNNLWVADSGSNRVLQYTAPFTTGMGASVAIGQPDLTSSARNQGSASPTASSLANPGYPVFDSEGNLWVADFLNNRLLQFRPPFSTGMAASVVLGQPDFTHATANQGGAVQANTLSGASGAAIDSLGNLWVPDGLNHRVLEFKPPFTTNMPASLVIGQVDFAHGSANQAGAAPAAATLSFPHQVAFDSQGRLFVSDSGNNRTLVFAPPFSNGMNASLVLGQADFTSATAANTAAGQSFPTGVTTAR